MIKLIILSLILSSCASRNYHAENYIKNIDITQVPKPVNLKEGTDPLIVSTENLDQDYFTLLSKNFIFLGYSTFAEEMDEKYNVIQQGRDVGATLILTTNTFLGIKSSTIPLLLPTSSTTSYSGNFSGTDNTRYSNAYGSLYGQTNSNYNGTYNGQATTQSSQWVPMTVSKSIFKQTSIFFVKTEQTYKFGAYYRDLTPDERKKVGRNTGAVVTLVIENSPAFNKNILAGDIILSINGVEVKNYADANNILSSISNLELIKIQRTGAEKIVSFKKDDNIKRNISSQK